MDETQKQGSQTETGVYDFWFQLRDIEKVTSLIHILQDCKHFRGRYIVEILDVLESIMDETNKELGKQLNTIKIPCYWM